MSTARDMATLGRRLVYDFPQYYNIFGRTSTSAGIATVRNTNRRVLEAYPGRRRHQDRLHQGGGLQPRLLGAARRQAGDRGAPRRQVDRLAQRRGGAADGPRLRQDAGARRGWCRRRRCAASPSPGGCRRRGGRAARTAAVVAQASAAPALAPRVPAAAAGDRRRRDRAQQRDHRGGDRRGERRADRGAGGAQRARRRPARDGRPMPRPRRRPGRARRRRRRLRLDLRGGAPRSRRRPRRGEPSRSRWRASSAGTTGGNDWGVQLGAYRAKGDAERQLLTTALKDVPRADRRAAPGRGGAGAGRDRLPRPVRRPEPGGRARRLRERWRGCRPTACRSRRGSERSPSGRAGPSALEVLSSRCLNHRMFHPSGWTSR